MLHGGGVLDKRALRLHDTTFLGHLVLADRDDPSQHDLRDGLVEHRLNTAERDDQTVLDNRATPFGVARLVKMGSILLNLAARQAGVECDHRLGEGDLVVLLLAKVSVVDTLLEQNLPGSGVEDNNGAGQLVGELKCIGCLHGTDRYCPGRVADIARNTSKVGH